MKTVRISCIPLHFLIDFYFKISKRKRSAKKLQQEVQLQYTYFPIYQDASAPKRKDKKKIEADLHCQIYFLRREG